MLEKLAKQTAVYGISTILGRFLSYMLTPFYTRVFLPGEYGIITDVYALIPFIMTLLTLGMESSYFRFAAKAEAAGGDVAEAKKRLFATTWGITSLAAVLFFAVTVLFDTPVSRLLGPAYVAHPQYVLLLGGIVALDVICCIPFSRLREQGRAMHFVLLKLLNIIMQVGFALIFWALGLLETDFGVGWVLVSNLMASAGTLVLVLMTTRAVAPRIDRVLLSAIFVYSLPLLISGLAGTANEFIDRQLIKYLVPVDSMSELGIYGAIVKIGVVMTLFTQMYRLAAEPFFLSNFRKEQFVEMNAAALKYFIAVSIGISLGIILYKDLFVLIVGESYRTGVSILPVVLAGNLLCGVWLNLSFWYKREERTSLALWITLTGLAVSVAAGFVLVPRWGYHGAAWGRFCSEAAMVAVSYALNRRFFPTPYDLRGIAFYVVLGAAVFVAGDVVATKYLTAAWRYSVDALLLAAYGACLLKREKINIAEAVKQRFGR